MISLTNAIVMIQLITGCNHSHVTCAIAQIETSCNHSFAIHCKHDNLVGSDGEWGRYQIKLKSRPKSTYIVVNRELAKRLIKFKELYGEKPYLNEIYILWNAPSYLIGPKMGSPIPKKILIKSYRFENILKDIKRGGR